MISTEIEYNPETRIRVWHHYDPDTDITTVEEIQDAEPIIKYNRDMMLRETSAPVRAGASHLTPGDREGIQNGWMHVGRIPAIVEQQWMKEGIHLWRWGRCEWTRKKIKQKLNSPEWRYLRVGNAKL